MISMFLIFLKSFSFGSEFQILKGKFLNNFEEREKTANLKFERVGIKFNEFQASYKQIKKMRRLWAVCAERLFSV